MTSPPLAVSALAGTRPRPTLTVPCLTGPDRLPAGALAAFNGTQLNSSIIAIGGTPAPVIDLVVGGYL